MSTLSGNVQHVDPDFISVGDKYLFSYENELSEMDEFFCDYKSPFVHQDTIEIINIERGYVYYKNYNMGNYDTMTTNRLSNFIKEIRK